MDDEQGMVRKEGDETLADCPSCAKYADFDTRRTVCCLAHDGG